MFVAKLNPLPTLHSDHDRQRLRTMPRALFWALALSPLLLLLLYTQLLDPSTSPLQTYFTPLLTLTGLNPRSRAPIIIASMSAFGHMEKMGGIASGLSTLGYPITFITGYEFQDRVNALGVTFAPLDGSSEAFLPPSQMAEFLSLQGLDQELMAIKAVFLAAIPDQHRTVQRVFTQFQSTHPNKPLIFLYDSSFQGLSPVLLGAPGIRPHAAIGVGVAPLPQASNDTFPFRSGSQPDTSARAREVHAEAARLQAAQPFYRDVDVAYKAAVKGMGATETVPSMWDAFGLLPDVLLQFGVPEFEYPRSDLRPNVKWIGANRKVGLADQELPKWWGDVLAAKEQGKTVVAVTSSSVDFDPGHLIIPALEAMAGREDLLVVATLVTSEVEGLLVGVPANARVAKFVPLDLLLPFVSLI